VREAGTEPGACVERGWALALGRAPSEAEKTAALQLIEKLAADPASSAPLENPGADLAKLAPQQAAALAKLCLAILNLNEFMFVD
jgi:hypothetical protein